jgi:hypothetical protein
MTEQLCFHEAHHDPVINQAGQRPPQLPRHSFLLPSFSFRRSHRSRCTSRQVEHAACTRDGRTPAQLLAPSYLSSHTEAMRRIAELLER